MSNNLSFQRINVEKPPDVFNCWWDEWERLCVQRGLVFINLHRKHV